jgi:hypothetical protein
LPAEPTHLPGILSHLTDMTARARTPHPRHWTRSLRSSTSCCGHNRVAPGKLERAARYGSTRRNRSFTKSPGPRSSILAAYSATISTLYVLPSFRRDEHEPGRVVNRELTLARYAAFLNCSNRIAHRSRSGRSSTLFGLSISVPAIDFNPSSRKAPSWISSSRSET